MSKFDSITNVLHLVLQFVELGKTKGIEEKLQKAATMAEQGKFEDIKNLMADIKGKGFADENLHARTVRLLEPELRRQYKSYLAKLRSENEKKHDNLIICLASETDEAERLAKMTELAECANYDEFIVTIDAYGYDQPETTVQKTFTSLCQTLKTGLNAAGNGFKTAGEGIKNTTADLSIATGAAFSQMNTDFNGQTHANVFRDRMRAKYEASKKKKGDKK